MISRVMIGIKMPFCQQLCKAIKIFCKSKKIAHVSLYVASIAKVDTLFGVHYSVVSAIPLFQLPMLSFYGLLCGSKCRFPNSVLFEP